MNTNQTRSNWIKYHYLKPTHDRSHRPSHYRFSAWMQEQAARPVIAHYQPLWYRPEDAPIDYYDQNYRKSVSTASKEEAAAADDSHSHRTQMSEGP